jgi:eukaryotic-like serine/threonine-protein kinase
MSGASDVQGRMRLAAALVLALAAPCQARAADWKVPFEGSRSRPAVANGVVYVGSEAGAVYALDAASGSARWRFQTAPVADATPVVAEGTVFVGAGDGVFHALDALTGQERWSFRAGGPIHDRASVHDGLVLFVSDDGLLHGLDASTGRQAWAFDTLAGVPKIKRRPPTAPIVADGVAYLVTWPIPDVSADLRVVGYIVVRAVDAASGREKWAVRVDGSLPSPPRLVQGVLVLGTSSGTAGPVVMRALDPRTGAEQWRYSAVAGGGSATAAVALGDTVFFGTSRGLYALDVRSGAVRWTRAGERLPGGGPDDDTNPTLAVDADGLYAASRGGTLSGGKRGGLWALDPATGQDRWHFGSDGDIVAIDGAAVYLYGDGRLHAVRRATGKPIRSAGAGSSDALPLVVEGVAYVPGRTTTYFGTSRRDQGYLRALDLRAESR